MAKYIITDIKYDTDGQKVILPKEFTINVPDDIEGYEEIADYIGDAISNETGFCHLDFATTPKIPE